MKLLVLGGTVFLGKHLVLAALEQGHEVTLFNRGQSRPEAFPDLEQLRGNRDGGLNALTGRTWDAVIDTCGYVPRIVGQSVRALAHFANHYTFISSVSVYSLGDKETVAEGDPVGLIFDPRIEEITGDTYGPLKALCEQEVRAGFTDRALVIRPGLIVGPDDPTDRFSYWPARMARGGRVVVPDRRDQPLQIIDVRDLATWIVSAIGRTETGIFNATGPADPYALGEVLTQIRDEVNPSADLAWTSPATLSGSAVTPWADLPLYLGPTAESDAMMRADVTRATSAGLRFRPLQETIRATLAWTQSRPTDYVWKAGLTEQREAEILSL